MKSHIQQRIQSLQDEITLAENKLKSNVSHSKLMALLDNPLSSKVINNHQHSSQHRHYFENIIINVGKLLFAKKNKKIFVLYKVIRSFLRK